MSLSDLAEHGLPAGFEQGCRGAGECPNHGTKLLVCRDAWSRYRSDFSFKKRVDRGLTAAEIFEEERAEVEASRPVVAKAKQDPAASGACSRWAERGAFHLVFANPRPLATPIPYRGALGLRRFNETVDAGILRELAGVL